MLDTHFESVDGRRLRVARTGEGPPLLLLHGYPETLQIYCRLALLLARHYSVLAFDWPGMGGSEEWLGGASPVQMAERLVRLLDHFGIEKASVLAMDMGGQPALVAAAEWPDRIDRLVVSNSLVLWDEATSWEIRVLRQRGWNRFFIDRFPRVVFRRAERTFLAPGERLAKEIRDDFWRHFRKREVRRYISRMCAGYQGLLPRLPAYYERVRSKTLVLWGADDAHFPKSHGERLARLVPGAELAILPGAGHWMVWSRPEEIAAHIVTAGSPS